MQMEKSFCIIGFDIISCPIMQIEKGVCIIGSGQSVHSVSHRRHFLPLKCRPYMQTHSRGMGEWFPERIPKRGGNLQRITPAMIQNTMARARTQVVQKEASTHILALLVLKDIKPNIKCMYICLLVFFFFSF